MRFAVIALVLIITGAVFTAGVSGAEDAPASTKASMNNAQLDELLRRIDPQLKGDPGNWTLRVQGIPARVITDEAADRMRILVAIGDANRLDKEALYRVLQANFESALDARYAIAHETVWSAFIHPLSTLTPGDLTSAVAQTYNAALTFGGSYSSGMFQFGGGDNRDQIFDEVMERGTPL